MENKNNNSIVDNYNRPLPNISLDTLTESLGFESSNEKSKCSFDEAVEEAERRSRSRSNTEAKEEPEECTNEEVADFPPLLSSLNENRRPRFNLEKVRENGRLQISYVENRRPEVIVERTPPGEDEGSDGGDGRVRIRFIDEETKNNSSSASASSSSSSCSGKEE